MPIDQTQNFVMMYKDIMEPHSFTEVEQQLQAHTCIVKCQLTYKDRSAKGKQSQHSEDHISHSIWTII